MKKSSDVELGVVTLKVADMVVSDAMAQNQVLCAGGCADGVGLNKTESLKGLLQRCCREDGLVNGKAAQVGKG